MTYFKSSHAGSVHCTSIPFSRKKLTVGVASILMAAAGLTLIPAAPVFAQESATTNTAQNGEGVEEIIVSGIRFSQRSALDRKKESVTMSDSLVAEDIGEFPDKNIAEALSRIPGVQIARGNDGNEGSMVSVRGVSPDLLRVEMNNVGAMGMAGSRGIDFRDMASELVKSLDVIKGSEARLTEGGIGGTIHVNTRRPNDFDDHYLSISGEGQYNDLIGDVMPKFNLTGVRKINDRLGVLLNVTASDKTTIIHAIRNTEWDRFADYDESAERTYDNPKFSSIDSKAGCAALSGADVTDCQRQWMEFSPYLPRYGIWEREESRLSANTMVQFALTDDLSIHAGYTYNERDKAGYDINLQFETNSAARVDPTSVVVDDRHNVVAFSTRDATVSNRVLAIDWMQKTSMFETGFEFKRDQIELTGVAARSTSDQDIDSRGTTAWAGGIAGMQVNLNRDGLPHIDLSNAYIRNAADLTDQSRKFHLNSPESYVGGSSFNYRPSRDETQEDMAKLDFSFSPEDSFFTKFQTGFQYNSQQFANWNWRHDINRNVGTAYNGNTWTMDDQVSLLSGITKETPKFFDHYSLGVNTLGSWQAVDANALLAGLRNVSADSTERRDLFVQAGNFDVEVNTNAFYGQANFETSLAGIPVTGNMGVRVVDTKSYANGDVRIRVMVDELDENGNPKVNPTTGAYAAAVEDADHAEAYNGRQTFKKSYTEVLPSLNLTFGLVPEELELFFGVAEVMAHPRIGDINVNANCTLYYNAQAIIDRIGPACTAGNPGLDPYRAFQMDVALTWYPNEMSIVSAALFTKDMDTWILGADRHLGIDFLGDGRSWEVRQPSNGKGAKTKGLELQASTIFTMLPAPFDGFGGAANYTWMDSEDTGIYNQLTGEELPFTDQSKHSYNITLFYETDVWSARMAYNYRDQFLQYTNDRSGNPGFVDAAGYLDAKFNYNINDNFKVHIDGRNLTGEVRSVNAGPGRMSTYEWAGREYAIGFTWRM